METKYYRNRSLRLLEEKGIYISTSLPVIENINLKSADQIVDRILCMNVAAAVAYGYDRAQALQWLERESMLGQLTNGEKSFVIEGEGNADNLKVQVEAMWALAWVMKIVDVLDFWKVCDPRFATMLPNLKLMEPSLNFRERAFIRSADEIGAAADLAYCLHWSIREAELKKADSPAGVIKYVIEERRKALDWTIGENDWDHIPLDT